MNTMALQLAGLWDEREATTKQTMDFGPDGLPNGYVRENSAMCVQSCWERYTVEEIKDILESTCLEAASKGIVQVHTDDFNLIADDDFEDVLNPCSVTFTGRMNPVKVMITPISGSRKGVRGKRMGGGY